MRSTDSFSPTPKYAKLAQRFRQQIESGELKPGDRLPSFVELRSQLGIGQSTLERAHALLEQEALIVREPGRGIFVAGPRQRKLLNVIGVTGISYAKGQHPYFAALMEGVQEAAHRNEIEILLLHNNSSIHWEKVDGVLLYDWQPEVYLRRMPPGMPCVSLVFPALTIPSVVPDDYQGMRAATEHLIELGHRRIAYLIAWQEDTISRQRLAGYQDALRAAGIEPDARWVHHLRDGITDEEKIFSSFIGWGREKMEDWLAHDWHELGCSALLAQNDDTAIGAINSLHAAGLEVPGDVSVVGFDNTTSGAHFHPRLTTVTVPLAEIGRRSVELLLRQTTTLSNTGGRLINPTALETKLEARDSTAPFKAGI